MAAKRRNRSEESKASQRTAMKAHRMKLASLASKLGWSTSQANSRYSYLNCCGLVEGILSGHPQYLLDAQWAMTVRAFAGSQDEAILKVVKGIAKKSFPVDRIKATAEIDQEFVMSETWNKERPHFRGVLNGVKKEQAALQSRLLEVMRSVQGYQYFTVKVKNLLSLLNNLVSDEVIFSKIFQSGDFRYEIDKRLNDIFESSLAAAKSSGEPGFSKGFTPATTSPGSDVKKDLADPRLQKLCRTISKTEISNCDKLQTMLDCYTLINDSKRFERLVNDVLRSKELVKVIDCYKLIGNTKDFVALYNIVLEVCK